MNKIANNQSLYCEDCEFLNITELSQDNMRELGRMFIPNHHCMKYKKRIYHISNSNFGLARLNACIEAEKEGLMPEKKLLEKKDINVFRGKIVAGEHLTSNELNSIFEHIEILENLLDQTDALDFMGFDFGDWREFVQGLDGGG